MNTMLIYKPNATFDNYNCKALRTDLYIAGP